MKVTYLIASMQIVAVLAVSTKAAAQVETVDSAQVALQGSDVSATGRLTFSGRGYAPGEATSVIIEDAQGTLQAQLEPARVEADGQIYALSVNLPAGLAPGAHVLHITGLTSGRFGHAAFNLQWQPPSVHLESYTGKPTHVVGYTGAGFVPGETVDIYLGDQNTGALTSVAADNRGNLSDGAFNIPYIGAGDYRLTFVGRTSQQPVSVGLNIQGFRPWVVLANYYVSPRSAVGFIGHDFIPGESVSVYLNTRLNAPVAQITADATGGFTVDNAFALPDLTGNNELIFEGQQSHAEVSASFAAAAP